MKKLSFTLIAFLLFASFGLATNVAAADAPKTVVQDTPVVSANTDTYSWSKKKALGVVGFGYYEINSDWESLYYDFAADSTNTAGAGFAAFFDIGASDKISIEISMGYSRLLTSFDVNRNTIEESYFVGDVTMHYHFYNSSSWDAYAIAGAGGYFSGVGAAPVLDIGIGNYIKLSKDFFLKAEVIGKSAVILNRAEARVGFAYQF